MAYGNVREEKNLPGWIQRVNPVGALNRNLQVPPETWKWEEEVIFGFPSLFKVVQYVAGWKF